MPRRRSPRPPHQPRAGRTWSIPPALAHEPTDPYVEAAAILDEHSGAAALFLWQLVRDLLLWGATPAERRAALFAPGAGGALAASVAAVSPPPDVEWALRTLIGVVSSPAAADPAAASRALVRVSQWAEAGGHGATALWYAVAAHGAMPAGGNLATEVGRLASALGRRLQAETWFRRAIALARQSGEWRAYALAFSGLGDLYREAGDLRRARRAYARVARTARRHGLPAERRVAEIRIVQVAIDAGAFQHAHARAEEIRRAFRPQDPGFLPFVLDHAETKLRVGDAAGAAADLQDLVLEPLTDAQRARAASLLAFAAATLGDAATSIAAWDMAERALAASAAGKWSAGPLLDLARAAAQVGMRTKAAATAVRALAALGPGDASPAARAAEALIRQLRS